MSGGAISSSGSEWRWKKRYTVVTTVCEPPRAAMCTALSPAWFLSRIPRGTNFRRIQRIASRLGVAVPDVLYAAAAAWSTESPIDGSTAMRNILPAKLPHSSDTVQNSKLIWLSSPDRMATCSFATCSAAGGGGGAFGLVQERMDFGKVNRVNR
ncbi:hypothetical protein MKZ38_006816 [Zalerion maritima]|uniref:Uncharacterized protein n=1 Tax=Zalerion maritima TaxID=339359 RepID=A0AAD5RVE4_9PEZI|nr:hypothetical protein MKZ38_006816 [Zalerion maritima]